MDRRRKLTELQAIEIIESYVPYCLNFGAHALARKFGVTPKAIRDIATGISWKKLRKATAKDNQA